MCEKGREKESERDDEMAGGGGGCEGGKGRIKQKNAKLSNGIKSTKQPQKIISIYYCGHAMHAIIHQSNVFFFVAHTLLFASSGVFIFSLLSLFFQFQEFCIHKMCETRMLQYGKNCSTTVAVLITYNRLTETHSVLNDITFCFASPSFQ